MRLGDYKCLTDYKTHKQWDHDASWTLLNASLTSSRCPAAVIWKKKMPWRLFGSERDSHWIWTKFLFYAGVAFRALCSAAYAHEHSDSTQPAYADITMTSVATVGAKCSRDSVVSIMASVVSLSEGLAWKPASAFADLWNTPLKVPL